MNTINLLPFSVDRWVLLSPEAQVLLTTLRMQIAQIELQQTRIVQNLALLQQQYTFGDWQFRQLFMTLAPRPEATERDVTYYSFLADIHLWLVSWESVNKTLRSIRKLLPGKRIDWIHQRRSNWFVTLNSARNHLEHIDERLLRPTVSKISYHTNVYLSEKMSKIVIFDVRLGLGEESFKRVNTLKTELANWYTSLPSTLDSVRRVSN